LQVVITGGTGFIGRALAASLARDGHRAIVLSRRPESAPVPGPGVEVVRWDGRSADGWGQLVAGAGAIVNLAGESITGTGWIPSHWTAARKRRIAESRTSAGLAVVQAIEGAGGKLPALIQASAVGYYGPHDDEAITEDCPPGSDFLASVCVAWEASTQRAEALGARRVLLRTGLVLDAHAGALPRLMLPFKFFAGGPLGSGRQWCPWIHIADEVRAIRFLIESPEARGPFNLTAPNPLTNLAFSRALGKAMGRPALALAPAFALRLALGEMATLVVDGQRALPARLAGLGFCFAFPDAGAALRDLVAGSAGGSAAKRG